MFRSIFSSFGKARPSKSVARKHRFRPELGVLEDRVVPTVSAIVQDQVLHVTSDTASDTISVDADQTNNHIKIFTNSDALVFDGAVVNDATNTVLIRQVRVEGGGGVDALFIRGTLNTTSGVRTDVVVAGDVERVTLGRQVNDLRSVADIHSNVTLEGASALTVDATADSGGAEVIVSQSYMMYNFPGQIRINYTDNLSSLTVRTGAGADAVYMDGLVAPSTFQTFDGTDTVTITGTFSPVSVETGNQADTVFIGDTFYHSLDSISANRINVNGGNDGSVDSLSFDDSGAANNRATATIDATSIARRTNANNAAGFPDVVTVNYVGFETIDYFADPGTFSSILVRGTAAGATTHIHTSDQNFVSVGDTNLTLTGIVGALDVIGATTGTDRGLFLNDSGMTTAQTYTIDGNKISRAGIAAVTYTGIHGFAIGAGTNSDTFNVVSIPTTAATTGIDLLGGDGGNTLVGTTSSNLFYIDDEYSRGFLEAAGGHLDFERMTSLVGGAASDRFVYGTNFSLANINGMGGIDTVDYSARTQGVTVDLGLGRTTFGNFSMRTLGIEIVLGSSVSDTITGSAAAEVLVGNGGADIIDGRGGLDVLIGGDGQDSLTAGSADTILIGGSTLNDTNPAALARILSIWQRTDLTYETKGAALTTTSGGLLQRSRQIADAAVDRFFGGSGRDLFFFSSNDIFGGVLPQSNEARMLI
jgi:hypothetical protein